ncbi:MAG TPA: polysaccharide deacetylase family protein, partial [Thermoplasmata archaeon]|nr:polysaccharide deacetylase family protein [Thermoplasmata archaeon]
MKARRVDAKMRVALTFDVDAESAQVRETPNLPVALSKGRFARIGVPRILDLLDKYGIRSTFFTPGWTAQAYPEMLRDIVRRGHELAAHGYLHEHLAELDVDAERKVHERSVSILEAFTGQRPRGFRAPYYEWSERTPGILRELGFRYDSSRMDDDEPYRIDDGPAAGLTELPVEWFLEDWVFFEEQRQPPSAVLET